MGKKSYLQAGSCWHTSLQALTQENKGELLCFACAFLYIRIPFWSSEWFNKIEKETRKVISRANSFKFNSVLYFCIFREKRLKKKKGGGGWGREGHLYLLLGEKGFCVCSSAQVWSGLKAVTVSPKVGKKAKALPKVLCVFSGSSCSSLFRRCCRRPSSGAQSYAVKRAGTL